MHKTCKIRFKTRKPVKSIKPGQTRIKSGQPVKNIKTGLISRFHMKFKTCALCWLSTPFPNPLPTRNWHELGCASWVRKPVLQHWNQRLWFFIFQELGSYYLKKKRSSFGVERELREHELNPTPPCWGDLCCPPDDSGFYERIKDSPSLSLSLPF
jgi:hypothetical protein